MNCITLATALFIASTISIVRGQEIVSKSNEGVELLGGTKNEPLSAPHISWQLPLSESVELKDSRFVMRAIITSENQLKNAFIYIKAKKGNETSLITKTEVKVSDASKKGLKIDRVFTLDDGLMLIELEVETIDGQKAKSTRLAYVRIKEVASKDAIEKSAVQNSDLKSANGCIALLPSNPHYFLYQNKPLILVGASEHYGSLVNRAFDFRKYLETVANDGLNYVRVYGGSYVEKVGDFGIQRNTLAPSPANLVLPWKRSDSTGYFLGGNKFDLNIWDNEYFIRLKEFLSLAREKRVIVELTLFSAYYGNGWKYSPFNPVNNVNSTDNIPHELVHTNNNGSILKEQEKYVRKLVKEVNEFDNLYFEIQNEPWADQVDTIFLSNEYDLEKKWTSNIQVVSDLSKDWQKKVSQWIKDEESPLKNKHLISQDVSNFAYPITVTDPNVDVYNFHYANRRSVEQNYHLNKPIGFNETGFAGKADRTYRRQAWRFLMEGGSVFNQLDFSFGVGREIGSDSTYKSPGGGSFSLRRQLGALKSYFERFDLSRLRSDREVIKASPSYYSQAISNGKDMWMIYLEPMSKKSNDLSLNLPTDKRYEAEWLDAAGIKTFEAVKFDGSLLKVPSGSSDKIVIIQVAKAK